MRFTESADPVNRWQAQLISAVYLGHRWEVGLKCLGVGMRAWNESEIGGAVSVHVPPMLVLGYALRKSNSAADTS
jgi:hypothetical protein